VTGRVVVKKILKKVLKRMIKGVSTRALKKVLTRALTRALKKALKKVLRRSPNESPNESPNPSPNESPKESPKEDPKLTTLDKETTVNKEQHSIAHDNYESTTPNQNIKHSILIKNALKAAQHKAKELLTIEENKMVRLVKVILEAQMKKMELKEEAFNDLKGNFKNERIELMKIREGYKSEIEEIKKEM
ncbi:Chromatin remodeling factor subunit, transcription factor, partial [Trachipleistophora hominis]